MARETTKPAAELCSRGSRRRSRSISRPARSSKNASPSRARTRKGRSTSTRPRTAGPIRMPAAISKTTEGIRTAGASPRPSGTRKAIAATIANPAREILGIVDHASLNVRCLHRWLVRPAGRSPFVLAVAVDLDKHLNSALLLGEEPDHLLVVVETL